MQHHKSDEEIYLQTQQVSNTAYSDIICLELLLCSIQIEEVVRGEPQSPPHNVFQAKMRHINESHVALLQN
jgi:hypothetical protein